VAIDEMNELCFLSNLTSVEWAAWVQAVGSTIAIFASAGIAIYITRLQHNNALDLHKTEKHTEKIEIAKTLLILATNSSKIMKFIASQLNDSNSVHNAANGLNPCDIGELQRIDKYLNDIPLQTVPHSMVTLTMILGATVRQFKEKVEMVLENHDVMNKEMFDDFFQTVGEMNNSIELTCIDIDEEVNRIDSSE
jgi:hypothetical protein